MAEKSPKWTFEGESVMEPRWTKWGISSHGLPEGSVLRTVGSSYLTRFAQIRRNCVTGRVCFPSELGGGAIVSWRCVSDVQGDDEMRETQRSRRWWCMKTSLSLSLTIYIYIICVYIYIYYVYFVICPDTAELDVTLVCQGCLSWLHGPWTFASQSASGGLR